MGRSHPLALFLVTPSPPRPCAVQHHLPVPLARQPRLQRAGARHHACGLHLPQLHGHSQLCPGACVCALCHTHKQVGLPIPIPYPQPSNIPHFRHLLHFSHTCRTAPTADCMAACRSRRPSTTRSACAAASARVWCRRSSPCARAPGSSPPVQLVQRNVMKNDGGLSFNMYITLPQAQYQDTLLQVAAMGLLSGVNEM